MASSYKVKKGDTLSGIAQALGVKQGDISGYKSGNPDLIYEGEELSVGSKPQEYASAVKEGMKDEYSTEQKDEGYDVEKIRGDIDTYKTKMDDAFQTYKKSQSETFNKEYETRGLGTKKNQIKDIDDQIAAAREERDNALFKEGVNPNVSAGQLTGKQKKVADFYNSKINNLIDNRNSVASEYNTELGEVTRLSEVASNEAKAEYDYFANLLNRLDSQLGSYRKELLDSLEKEQTQSNWEKELAQALQIAQMKNTGGGSSKVSLVRDPRTGDPLYWFNPDTQEIEYVDQGGESGNDFDNLNVEDSTESQPGFLQRAWNWIFG